MPVAWLPYSGVNGDYSTTPFPQGNCPELRRISRVEDKVSEGKARWKGGGSKHNPCTTPWKATSTALIPSFAGTESSRVEVIPASELQIYKLQ